MVVLSQLRSTLGTLWGHRDVLPRAVGRQQIDPWASVLLQRAVLEVWHLCACAVLPLLPLNLTSDSFCTGATNLGQNVMQIAIDQDSC